MEKLLLLVNEVLLLFIYQTTRRHTERQMSDRWKCNCAVNCVTVRPEQAGPDQEWKPECALYMQQQR